jgi:hypothetical protein
MRIIFLLCLIPTLILSQDVNSIFKEKGEIYFSFKYKNRNQLNKLSKIISLDHKIQKDSAFAYANKKEFSEFLNFNINYNIIDNNKIFNQQKSNNWDYYPSYSEYVNLMENFADSFPSICKLHRLGVLNSGREILIIQISNNVGIKENEPSFLYTSSMHGDELTGYVLMLRLIDDILHNYSTNNYIKNLVDNIDIWINPLANPDGTYAGGNNNVFSATRSNANNIDLNRNYPDPQDGLHPDGNSFQPETMIFMGLADTVNFNLASNLHTGSVVANYPWDTWSNTPADLNWWEHVCNEYSDTCQLNGNSNYFTDFNNGITNGFDWYEVDGGRQDYSNYFNHSREFTLELSNNKTPNPSSLPYYWNANISSLYNFIQQSLFGLRGIVTDSISGQPLKAFIEVLNHDIDSSQVFSTLPIGNYHRYLYQGNYQIKFSKNGYHSKTINTSILNNSTTTNDIQLVPINFVNINEIINEENIYQSIDILGKNKNSKNKKNQIIFEKSSINKIKKIIILE